MSWLKSHWKKLAGIAVGAASVFYPPLAPILVPLGSAIIGSDFQVGSQLGTPVGSAAKDMVKQVKAVLPKSGK